MLDRILIQIKIRIKYVRMNYKHILSSTIKALGISLTVFEFITELLPVILNKIEVNDRIINVWTFFIAPIVIATIWELAKIDRLYYADPSKERKILVSVGDYFDNLERNKDAVNVFTLDDSFDMDPFYLGNGSVHQRFVLKYFKNRHEDLQKSVNNDLAEQNIMPLKKDKLSGKEYLHFPIGSVVSVKFNLKGKLHETLMLANSYRKEKIGAFGMRPGQEEYIPDLWRYIHDRGIISDRVMVNLFGTKFAMVNKSRNAVAEEIIDSFLKSEAFKNRDVKLLILSISPEFYIDGSVNVEELGKYIKSKCYLLDRDH